MVDFSALITSWYRLTGRDLPWRNTDDPYKIWLSEVVLQQTRVEQGKSYYLKFITHFPTVKDLAEASQDEVLNLWQGLGYYSRARNMHAAAIYIQDELGGKFPDSYQKIRELKGVGEYTAAAIASFAYDLPHAVVDGNVYRVLSRYLSNATPIDSTQGKKEFKMAAEELLDRKHPADHNQAIMELGALVCLPKNPKCDACPVADSCMAHKGNTQLNYPVKAKKTKVRNRYLNYLVLTDKKSIIIKKRKGKGIWQGLYDFPVLEYQKEQSPTLKEVGERDGLSLEFDGNFKHVLSHQNLFVSFWIVEAKEPEPLEGEIAVPIESIEEYPLPQLLIKYIRQSRLFEGN